MTELFDFAQLDELMSADPEELKVVLWDLFTDFGKSFAELHAKAEISLADVAMEAHQLRGVASSFGLRELSDQSRDLEFAAQRGEQERSLELISAIQKQLILSEQQLRILRPRYFEGHP